MDLTVCVELGLDLVTEDMDLPTLWDAVAFEASQDMRKAELLQALGHEAWNASMDYVNGELEIVDEKLFEQAQEFFAKAKEVEMRVS